MGIIGSASDRNRGATERTRETIWQTCILSGSISEPAARPSRPRKEGRQPPERAWDIRDVIARKRLQKDFLAGDLALANRLALDLVSIFRQASGKTSFLLVADRV